METIKTTKQPDRVSKARILEAVKNSNLFLEIGDTEFSEKPLPEYTGWDNTQDKKYYAYDITGQTIDTAKIAIEVKYRPFEAGKYNDMLIEQYKLDAAAEIKKNYPDYKAFYYISLFSDDVVWMADVLNDPHREGKYTAEATTKFDRHNKKVKDGCYYLPRWTFRLEDGHLK